MSDDGGALGEGTLHDLVDVVVSRAHGLRSPLEGGSGVR
jgi:hypothetical protein